VHVVSKVTAEQQVHDDEQIFVVVEREPEVDEEGMLESFEQIDLTDDVAQRVVASAHLLVRILHGVQTSAVFLLYDAYLQTSVTSNSRDSAPPPGDIHPDITSTLEKL